MALKGRIIQQPWIELILSGQKTWEMLDRSWSHRGPLALIEKGTGCVVGIAEVIDCLPKLDLAGLRQHQGKHRIPEQQFGSVEFKWFVPLVLTNVRRLPRPVRYIHKKGAHNPINIDDSAEEEIARLLGMGRSPSSPSGRPSSISALVARKNVEEAERVRRTGPAHPVGGAAASMADLAIAARVLTDVGQGPTNVRVPADAAVSVTRKGNKLYIDAVWDDAAPSNYGTMAGWAEPVGIFAALTALICMLGFSIHFALGLFSNSISAVSAFKWLLPMLISVVVATALGQGHLLRELFDERSA